MSVSNISQNNDRSNDINTSKKHGLGESSSNPAKKKMVERSTGNTATEITQIAQQGIQQITSQLEIHHSASNHPIEQVAKKKKEEKETPLVLKNYFISAWDDAKIVFEKYKNENCPKDPVETNKFKVYDKLFSVSVHKDMTIKSLVQIIHTSIFKNSFKTSRPLLPFEPSTLKMIVHANKLKDAFENSFSHLDDGRYEKLKKPLAVFFDEFEKVRSINELADIDFSQLTELAELLEEIKDKQRVPNLLFIEERMILSFLKAPHLTALKAAFLDIFVILLEDVVNFDDKERNLFKFDEDKKILRNPYLENEIIRIFLTQASPLSTHHKNVLLISKSSFSLIEFISGLFLKIQENDVPDKLKGARIIWVNSDQILANSSTYRLDSLKSKIVDQFTQSFTQMNETKKQEILVFENFDTLFRHDARDIRLIPALIKSSLISNPQLMVIAQTRKEEFFSNNKEDLENFALLNLDYDTEKKCFDSLYSKYTSLQFPEANPEIFRRIITLADRYLSQKPSPDRVIDIIEEAISRNSMEGKKPPYRFDEDQLLEILAKQANVPLTYLKDKSHVSREFIKNEIEKTIKGQPYAVKEVASAICRFLKGVHNKEKPPGVFIFAGPTGVGKTELAKKMAEIISGTTEKCEIIDMGNFSNEHTVATLFGAPSGYINSDKGGKLPNIIKSKKPSVLLFDEVEKANKKVQQALLPLLDIGLVQDMDVNPLSFSLKNTFIILTTNVGAEEISKMRETNVSIEELKEVISESFSIKVGPEWVGRTEIIPFEPLTADAYKKIIGVKLAALAQDLKKEMNLTIKWNEQVENHLFKLGVNTKRGARSVVAILDKEVRNRVADLDFKSGDCIALDFDESSHEITARLVS